MEGPILAELFFLFLCSPNFTTPIAVRVLPHLPRNVF
jgi:hypothetical protein